MMSLLFFLGMAVDPLASQTAASQPVSGQPAPTSPATSAPTQAAAAGPTADDPLVCRDERATGSRMTKRVCRPKSYLIAEQKAADEASEGMVRTRTLAQDPEMPNSRVPGR